MTDQLQAMLLLSKKPSTSHLLHLFMCILTVGVWLPIWMIVALSNSLECRRIDREIKKLIKPPS